MLKKIFGCFLSRYEGFLLSSTRMANSTACGGMTRVLTYRDVNDLVNVKLAYIIDVRSRQEVKQTGSIPNSLNIPLNELQEALNMPAEDFSCKYNREKPGPHTKIVFHCKSGGRSAEALRLALAMGYSDPYNYSGGWMDWEAHLKGEEVANRKDD